MLRNYKRYRAQKAEKSGAKAREDYRIGWATMDGVPTWRDIFREVMAPHARHQKYAQAFGLEKLADQKANLGILSQANAVEAMDKIKGHVLQVEMSGSKMVDHPGQTMIEEKQFPQASSTQVIVIDAPSHGSVMVDRSGKMMDQIALWLSKITTYAS